MRALLTALFGGDLAPRDRAARLLSLCLLVALVLLVLGSYLDAYRDEHGLEDSATQLLLGTFSLLSGTVGGHLARKAHMDDDGTRSPVGTILTLALGLAAVIICGFVFFDGLFSPGPGISPNTANLLASLLGGAIGATAAYLGLPTTGEDHRADQARLAEQQALNAQQMGIRPVQEQGTVRTPLTQGVADDAGQQATDRTKSEPPAVSPDRNDGQDEGEQQPGPRQPQG